MYNFLICNLVLVLMINSKNRNNDVTYKHKIFTIIYHNTVSYKNTNKEKQTIKNKQRDKQ